ncbi:multicopper oxidase [Nannochloropsis oceanica]
MPHTYGTTSTGNGQGLDDRQRLQRHEEEQAYRSRPNHVYQGLASRGAEEEEEEEEAKRDLTATSLPVVSTTYYEADEEGEYLARRVRQAGMGLALIVSVCACVMLFGLKGHVGGGGGRGNFPASPSPAGTGIGTDDLLLHHNAKGVHRPQELRQPEVRRAVNGVLDTTFRIQPTRITNGPVTFSTRTYEGTVPGPTLLLRPGETLRIHQVNGLGAESLEEDKVVPQTLHWPNTTTIHTHGLHIDPSGIADNMFRTLASGETALSEYHIRGDHQSGTFYYHPHYHGSSTIQMAGGMGGAILIDDSTTLPSPSSPRDLVCVLQHVNVAAGTFRNYLYAADSVYHSLLRPRVTYRYQDAPGNYFLVNGQFEPKLTLAPGEAVRLRLINAGINDYLLLQLPGCEMYEVAADGASYAGPPREKRTVLLVVGSRKDVLVPCPWVGRFPLTSSKQGFLSSQYLGEGTDVFEGVDS